MTHTKEDIERLVPEDFDIGQHCPYHDKEMFNALLLTRRQLEIAREALEKVKKIDRDGDLEWVNSEPESDEYWMEKWAGQLNDCGKISEHALTAIKELS